MSIKGSVMELQCGTHICGSSIWFIVSRAPCSSTHVNSVLFLAQHNLFMSLHISPWFIIALLTPFKSFALRGMACRVTPVQVVGWTTVGATWPRFSRCGGIYDGFGQRMSDWSASIFMASGASFGTCPRLKPSTSSTNSDCGC